LAAATVELLDMKRLGLYHVTNGGQCSWYDFARAIFELSSMSADLTSIASREYNAAARRPRYSVLSAAGVDRVGLKPMRPWREALAAYLAERPSRPA
jgi:dTDP-4-dehydrorhamnose reductase